MRQVERRRGHSRHLRIPGRYALPLIRITFRHRHRNSVQMTPHLLRVAPPADQPPAHQATPGASHHHLQTHPAPPQPEPPRPTKPLVPYASSPRPQAGPPQPTRRPPPAAHQAAPQCAQTAAAARTPAARPTTHHTAPAGPKPCPTGPRHESEHATTARIPSYRPICLPTSANATSEHRQSDDKNFTKPPGDNFRRQPPFPHFQSAE